MFAFTLTMSILLTLAAIVLVLFIAMPSDASRTLDFLIGVPCFMVLVPLAAWGWWAVRNADYSRGYEDGMRHAGEMMAKPVSVPAAPALLPEPNSLDTCQ